MPELVTPEGAPVALENRHDPLPAKTPDEINREFARSMAAEEPSAVPAPPVRQKAGEQPKRKPGRPRKNPEDKPRTEPVPPAQEKSEKDFTDECAGLSTLGWAALAATPYTSAYAVVVEANQEQLVTALNAGCQNNAKIRGAVERWSSGGGGVYMLQLAAVGTNMGVQTLQLLKDPDLRAEARAHTEGKFRDFLRSQGVKLPDGEPAEAAEDVPAPA